MKKGGAIWYEISKKSSCGFDCIFLLCLSDIVSGALSKFKSNRTPSATHPDSSGR